MTARTTRDDEIRESLSTLSNLVNALAVQVSRLKLRSVLLFISVVLDVLLSLGLGGLYLQSNSTSNEARAEVVARCESGNQQKAQEKILWNYILQQLNNGSKHTPQDNVILAQLQHHIDTAFAHSDCQHIKT